MKKKLVSMILCVAMVATMAVGCGSGAKNSGSSNNDKVADATTEVSDAAVEERNLWFQMEITVNIQSDFVV